MSPALRYETLMERAPATPGGFTLMCVLCGDPSPDEAAHRCPTCDGAIDAVHDLASVSTAEGPPQKGENPLQRYFDLLPVRDRNSLKWLGEGSTPCFTAEKLGERIGMSRIALKNESENPTRSTKDRIASVGLSRLAELGVRRFVMASTGNSSTAYAHGVQSLEGVELALFCGRRFRHRLNYPDHPSVTTYLVDGDFVEAGRAARRFALRTGAFTEGGFFNVARREGLKLAYLEAFDQMDAEPDHVFQAVSSGMGLLGAYKGALEYRLLGRLSRVPRFTAVQQAGCAPMARAYAEGAESIAPRHIVHDPKGPAEAILRGDPTRTYPYIREVCRSSGGRITSVSEAEINAARDLLEETEGLRVCHASATALAGAVKMRREGEIAADDVVLVNLTGGDRTGWATPERVRNVPADWPQGPVSWEDAPVPVASAGTERAHV
ncbi:threonine synthase [Nocardiopsis changdeensis]|uniref:Pyridoxal-phosphate dependent enzyme n=1 Tax=Nocardiopsis changdeensis TaxID=2831969 RepID=A0ABX8BQG2_9ACTN|nr:MULTISPECIES: pyridoxal-phosphate dependent enzyme [Nocardiopsis]QUX23965.1 pyridoxal-phosphate dependent enzyme [Nocardiopsis changdeensis]QYX39910.1 pyridoxal-phosphate dependent enzyme [Nocardiopsis sp. MT53]